MVILLSISCEEMKAMDSYAINNIGIPSIVLMENAALKVVKNLELDKTNYFTIICGVGNNGGDGLAVARHLILVGKNVDLFVIGNLEKATRDFNINLNILKNMDVSHVNISDDKDVEVLEESLKKSDMTIDAIFGIGLTRIVEGIYSKAIDTINKYSKNILSVDIPSGINGDSGKVMGIAIKANKTVSFHLVKHGLINNKTYTGEIIVEDIGIPKKVTSIILALKSSL